MPQICAPSNLSVRPAHPDIPLPGTQRRQRVPSPEERAEVDRLVAQARQGHRPAFQALVQRHQRKVYALARDMLHDAAQAHDAAQEVFLKAFLALDTFEGTASFSTWLHRITVNLCIDHQRKARTEHGALQDLGHTQAGELPRRRLGADPARTLLTKEMRQHLRGALQALSARHRDVLVLRELDGLSYRQMATTLGCAEGTIMSRLFHARRRMQELLRGYLDEHPGD